MASIKLEIDEFTIPKDLLVNDYIQFECSRLDLIIRHMLGWEKNDI
ncbi:hypothetical protein GCM10011409_37680 [Lentibacillus populi]|uniref:Uncharacterized protein n=1 Tax=Lentibacillus populi TaxID=1827502 RepID=A0A9W5U161_9BACI|nr:hypothetical protein GCM10011409_37680 [Lentibacillus populi]